MKKSNDFDTIAPFYDILAKIFFLGSISSSQYIYLEKIPPNAKILILGGGTGKLLPKILLKSPNVQITYIEKSLRMLRMSRKRITSFKTSKVNFIHGDETSIKQGDKYDVIITNFFLDVFTHEYLKRLLPYLYESLNYKGLWIMTDFVNPPSSYGLKKIFKHLLIKAMYSFFKVVSRMEGSNLSDYKALLLNEGLDLAGSEKYFLGMIEANLFVKNNPAYE